jgi:hypothetical protein
MIFFHSLWKLNPKVMMSGGCGQAQFEPLEASWVNSEKQFDVIEALNVKLSDKRHWDWHRKPRRAIHPRIQFQFMQIAGIAASVDDCKLRLTLDLINDRVMPLSGESVGKSRKGSHGASRNGQQNRNQNWWS